MWYLHQLQTTQKVMGGHWDFCFCGFGYFLGRFFGFCAKRSRFFGFCVRCGLQIFRFLASSFRFSQKIIAVFRFYYPMWFVFGFGQIFYGFAVLDEFFFGFAVSNIPQCPPLKCMWSVPYKKFPHMSLWKSDIKFFFSWNLLPQKTTFLNNPFLITQFSNFVRQGPGHYV